MKSLTLGNNLQLQPDEFEIEKVLRFPEISNVDNENILYLLYVLELCDETVRYNKIKYFVTSA